MMITILAATLCMHHQQVHMAFCTAISITWSHVQVNSDEAGAGFAEVGALSEAKDALREAVQLPLQHPHLFQKGSLARSLFLHAVLLLVCC